MSAAGAGHGSVSAAGAAPSRRLVVHPDPQALAAAVAARLAVRMLDAQTAGRQACVVLTGGGVGTAVLAALAVQPAVTALDLARVQLWWGDERFVAPTDPARNEVQARRALLDPLGWPPDAVHPMGAAGQYPSPEAAASAYAAELAAAAAQRGEAGPVPAFDVVLLGIGTEGHVASLFPGSPHLGEEGVAVAAVRDSPKPPPQRVTLTLPAIRTAASVWILAAGAEKAPSIARLLAGETDPVAFPAAGAQGRRETLVLTDPAAAGAAGC